MVRYGKGLERGYLGTPDPKNAMIWYKKSKDLNNPVGMNRYGYGLQRGITGNPNIQQAKECYKEAADLGYAVAMSNYGFILDTIDHKKALALVYFKMSADSGYVTGMLNTAHSYMRGYSGQQDFKSAFDYYKKAADLGNQEANNHAIAIIYKMFKK